MRKLCSREEPWRGTRCQANCQPCPGTGGLGRASLLAIAKQKPTTIYFTGRDVTAASSLQSEIQSISSTTKAIFLRCDQTSLTSVATAAKQIRSEASRLDLLVCNAGIMAKDPALTTDGYELQFGVNHMSHALFCDLLMPLLQATSKQGGQPRIVFLTSAGFRWTPSGGIVFPELKTVQDYWFAGRWVRYGQSKLANLLYAQQLAKRYPEIKTVSIHPGSIKTGILDPNWSWLNRTFVALALWGKWNTLEEGIQNTCWASTTNAGDLENGAFYEWVGVKGALTQDAENMALGDELWNWTQKDLERFAHH